MERYFESPAFFDAVRYEKEVSPRKMTLTSFFADALDEPIERQLTAEDLESPSKWKREISSLYRQFATETFRCYEDYIKKLLVNEEVWPNHINNDLKDRVKRRLRQEYNLDDVYLNFYYPEKGLFSIGFLQTKATLETWKR